VDLLTIAPGSAERRHLGLHRVRSAARKAANCQSLDQWIYYCYYNRKFHQGIDVASFDTVTQGIIQS
jgi:hypothetical protein